MKKNFLLYFQPIPLDRFIIIDAEATHAGRLAFVDKLTKKNISDDHLLNEAFNKNQ